MDQILVGIENCLIQDSFLRQVEKTPNATAILYLDRAWTYGELEVRSRVVAAKLIEKRLLKGDRVAILAERGPELIWTVLGVLRAGAAFVIMDSSYPQKRLEALISICSPCMIMVAGGCSLQETATALSQSTSVPLLVSVETTFTQNILPILDCDPWTDLAYLVFTSGSTGQPKGVACNHAALVHFIEWHVAHFGMRASDRFSMLSGLSHDPLLRDIFTPLSIGATLVIPPQSVITEPGRLRHWMYDTSVTIAHLTPPMGQLLVAGGRNVPEKLVIRKMFWGGDQLLPTLLDHVSQFAPSVEHVNFYGCSETPQAISYYRYKSDFGWQTVPIGIAVPGFQLSIVGNDKQELLDGEVGEIVVNSKYLSFGYLENIGKIIYYSDNSNKFEVKSIYYTGDSGLRLPDGNIMMLGRADDQIKIRGFRVDLSEVKNALQSHKSVLSAVALPAREGERVWLDAFVAHSSEHKPSEAELVSYLAQRLPLYMMPRKIWLFENKLPMLPNGKIDRAALQAHAIASEFQKSTEISFENPKKIKNKTDSLRFAWQDLFQNIKVLDSSSFSDLGGDSLTYVQAYLSAEEIVGILPIDWQHTPINVLCASATEKPRFWTSIDTPMLIRAIAVVLVVAYHFGLSNFGDGETGVMFLVSGLLFGNIQINKIFDGGSPSQILVSIKNILIPTSIFAVVASIASVWQGYFPPLSLLFFSTDLIDYHVKIVEHAAVFRHIIIFWYVHALIQVLMIMYVLVHTLPEKFKKRDMVFQTVSVWFVLGTAIKFILPIFLQADFLASGAQELSLAQISPIGNFATFALGMLLAVAPFNGKKFYLIIASALYSVIDGIFYGLSNAIPIFVGVQLILFIPRIRLPRIAAALAFKVSGASLFIYLGHVFIGFLCAKMFGAPPSVQLLAALAGGVGLHSLWDARRMSWGEAIVPNIGKAAVNFGTKCSNYMFEQRST